MMSEVGSPTDIRKEEHASKQTMRRRKQKLVILTVEEGADNATFMKLIDVELRRAVELREIFDEGWLYVAATPFGGNAALVHAADAPSKVFQAGAVGALLLFERP